MFVQIGIMHSGIREQLRGYIYHKALFTIQTIFSGGFELTKLKFILESSKSSVKRIIFVFRIHKREFDPLLKVNDNYPKYVLSLDDFDMSYMGVKHLNIINFLTGNEI